jgi:hypothetical protein
MKVYARDVHKEITQRILFQRATIKQKEFWKFSTQMYAVQCHQPLSTGMYTMYHLLMINIIKLGFIY